MALYEAHLPTEFIWDYDMDKWLYPIVFYEGDDLCIPPMDI